MLDAAAATGAGKAMLVADFRDFMLQLVTANSANFTVKVLGSLGVPITNTNASSQPVWTSPSSPTNPWTNLQMIDLADQSVINGATGVAATGTDINRQFEVNVNGQMWINVIITAYSAGNITVLGMPFNSSSD